MPTGRAPIPPILRDERGKREFIAPRLGMGAAVALGLIPGAVVWHITGRRLGVNAESEAWYGAAARPYRPPLAGAGESVTVVSTSADDTAVGTGARVVQVEYLDAEGWSRVGLAVLNGTTPAPVIAAQVSGTGNGATLTPLNTPITALRVNRVTVVSVGGGGGPAGDISVDMPGGQVQALPAGVNISASSRFTVPRGYVAVLSGIGYGTSRSLRGDVRVYAQPLGKPDYLFSTYEASGGALAVPLDQPIRAAGLGEVGLTFEKDGNGANIDVSSVLQPVLLVDPGDPDPQPLLQPSPLG